MSETQYLYEAIDEKGREYTAVITAYSQTVDPAVEFKERGISLFACSLYPEDKPRNIALAKAILAEMEKE